MHLLDEQEKLVVRHLIRDPRESDHAISELVDFNARTVTRKRQRLEEEGILSYHTYLNLGAEGAQQFAARHLYILKMRIGITPAQVREDIRREPFVRSVFTQFLVESHIAEVDGQIALVLVIEGASDADIVQTVQEQLIPSLLRNHGPDSIEDISTLRLLAPVRLLRNYLPFVNMEAGYLKKDWPDEAIYVGK